MPSSKAALFHGLTTAERQELIGLAQTHEYRTKTVVFSRGQLLRALYLVQSGCVVFGAHPVHGRRTIGALCTTGDVFGFTALAGSPTPAVASAYTLQPTTVWVWDSRILRNHDLYPKLAANLLTTMLRVLDEWYHRVESLTRLTAEQRLTLVLRRVMDTIGRPNQRGIEIPLTNKDAAALADTSLFTASRQMAKWEQQAAIEKGRGRLLIRKPGLFLAGK